MVLSVGDGRIEASADFIKLQIPDTNNMGRSEKSTCSIWS